MKRYLWTAALALFTCVTPGLYAHAAMERDAGSAADVAAKTDSTSSVGNQGRQPAGAGIGGSSGGMGGHDEAESATGAQPEAPEAQQSERAHGTGPGGDAGISAHEAEALADGAVATPDPPAGAVQENSIEQEKKQRQREEGTQADSSRRE